MEQKIRELCPACCRYGRLRHGRGICLTEVTRWLSGPTAPIADRTGNWTTGAMKTPARARCRRSARRRGERDRGAVSDVETRSF
jgi:hypothetical protein